MSIKKEKERLTIDVNFRFEGINSTKKNLGDMVIAEVKQAKRIYHLNSLELSKKKGFIRLGLVSTVWLLLLVSSVEEEQIQKKFLHLDKLQTI